MTTASEIAEALREDVTGLRGGASDRSVTHARPVDQCVPGALSYLKPGVANVERFAKAVSGASILCSAAHAEALANVDVTCLVTERPRLAFIRAVTQFLSPPRPAPGVHPSAIIADNVSIDPTATVMAGCVVGEGCSLGARSVLHPNVTLYANVRLGADVTVHSGTVIGADGYGYERNDEGIFEKFPHIGGVLIEDDVEIGSNTSIDRGTLGDTLIRSGARIDNQCHISHNVEIGRHTAVIAQSMIGGSVRVGDFCWLAPSAVIMNQVSIGDRATVGLGAVVVKSVPAGETVMGSPAVSSEEFRANRAALKKLISE